MITINFHCKWCKQEFEYSLPDEYYDTSEIAKLIQTTRIIHFQDRHIVKDKKKNGSKK